MCRACDIDADVRGMLFGIFPVYINTMTSEIAATRRYLDVPVWVSLRLWDGFAALWGVLSNGAPAKLIVKITHITTRTPK